MPTPSDDQPYTLLPLAGRKWRTAPHVQDRLGTVADLRQRGLSQLDIAGQLGVSPATISRDLSRLDLSKHHEHAELIYQQHLQSLLCLREAEQISWAFVFRYRYDPEHAAAVATAVAAIVDAQREAARLLGAARDAYDDEDEDDGLDAKALLKGLRDHQGADTGGSELSKLRRSIETEFPRYMGPKRVAIISRGLALAEHHTHDAAPAHEAPVE